MATEFDEIDVAEIDVPPLATLNATGNPALTRALERILDEAVDDGKRSAAFNSFI